MLPSIPAPVLAAFVVASLVLAATPGPGVLYIVTRTLAQGRRAGLASVAGVALGNLGNALAASLGLAALLAVSARAFDAVRFAGAAYLVYLGIRSLRAAPLPNGLAPPAMPRVQHLLRDGFIVALLNPKTALFFAAFLPQFIDPAAPALHSVLFGATFVAVAACTDTAYVLAAGVVAPALGSFKDAGRLGRCAAAAVYFGLGIFAAASGSRGAR
ncbi:MAG: LysE family translocator [Burkholderiales bacterium]|nr:LysE family translocator [Burkholderiales bacterium]MDE2297274.1 LysE family translocator [Burkholderiales bacterium]MDE2629286.1 LysE family translocator [Burkholderiales bacterium]